MVIANSKFIRRAPLIIIGMEGHYLRAAQHYRLTREEAKQRRHVAWVIAIAEAEMVAMEFAIRLVGFDVTSVWHVIATP